MVFGKDQRVDGKYNCKWGKHPIPWNIGLTKETDKRLRKIGRNITKAKKGKPSHKREPRVRGFCKVCGKEYWTWKCSVERKKYCSVECKYKGQQNVPMTLKQIQKSVSGSLKTKKITMKEQMFLDMLNGELELPYYFVGDGKLMVGRYCPDFKHKSQKKLIELCSYAIKKRELKRDEYTKYGYQCLFIHNIKGKHWQPAIIKRIIEFTNS